MTERSDVHISVTASPSGHLVLTIAGTLDSTTYHQIRDNVIKAALDEPPAVIVDVTDLHAPAVSAWAAFTSARWHVSAWPDVPVVLVCHHAEGRAAIRRSGITRYVPVHADESAAARSVDEPHALRRRVRAVIHPGPGCLGYARTLLTQWLAVWDRSDMALTAGTVATILIENTLEHTAGTPTLILEAVEDRATVAVSDESTKPAARQEDSVAGAHTVSGLAIVSALSRCWGNSPTAGGKTVWAVLGPENRL